MAGFGVPSIAAAERPPRDAWMTRQLQSRAASGSAFCWTSLASVFLVPMACAACAAGFPEIDGDYDQPSTRER